MPTLSVVSTLLDAVMNELRIPITNTTERAKIESVMAFVYGDICAKQDWWWLLQRDSFSTLPKITDGTISVTEGSATATLTTVPQRYSADVSLIDNVVYIDGGTPANPFMINTHSSAGALAVSFGGSVMGATSTAATYSIYAPSLSLPATVAKVLQVRAYNYSSPLKPIGIEDMNALLMQRREGRPEFWSVFDFATASGVRSPSAARQLQLYPFPDETYSLTVFFKYQQQGDLSDVYIPVDYQQVLVYGTLSRAYAVFLNDLDRSAYFLSLFNDIMALMAAQQREYASDHPGVTTNMLAYRQTSRRAYPSTLRSRFDTWPNG